MGLDLWFREDVARILASAHEGMAATMRASPALDEAWAEAYRLGFANAIRTIAVAFGVAAPSPIGEGETWNRAHAADIYYLEHGKG